MLMVKATMVNLSSFHSRPPQPFCLGCLMVRVRPHSSLDCSYQPNQPSWGTLLSSIRLLNRTFEDCLSGLDFFYPHTVPKSLPFLTAIPNPPRDVVPGLYLQTTSSGSCDAMLAVSAVPILFPQKLLYESLDLDDVGRSRRGRSIADCYGEVRAKKIAAAAVEDTVD